MLATTVIRPFLHTTPTLRGRAKGCPACVSRLQLPRSARPPSPGAPGPWRLGRRFDIERLLSGAGDRLLALVRRVVLLPLLGEIPLDVLRGGVETLA